MRNKTLTYIDIFNSYKQKSLLSTCICAICVYVVKTNSSFCGFFFCNIEKHFILSKYFIGMLHSSMSENFQELDRETVQALDTSHEAAMST